jgi:hypothetical protein
MEAKVVEYVPCKLTAEEELMKGKQVAQLLSEISTLEDEKKSEAKRIATEVEDKRTEMYARGEEIRRGEEMRPIECFERPRYVDNMVDLVRTDTGGVVRSRPMHPNERQTALDMGELPAPANPRPKRKSKHAEISEDAH